MAFEKRQLPKKSEDLADWYNRVVMLAELADYGPAKGTMIFRPYGYAIWELVQKEMDREIKEKGVENAYFPMFIPESLLAKEKDHVKGFSPELAVVTIGGGEELAEKLVVRPTSEAIMYNSYSKWVRSWRDLPILINQWNNVVRWEKRTYLFLRTVEFLWQEGHTAHATHDEAWEMVIWAMKMYEKTYNELFALPGVVGVKSETEKFAGADKTITFESLMPEGKSLQSCTSHDLGQNFSKVFDIKYQDKAGEVQYVWQTSWGFSTRSIGGLLMAHGDDAGLVLPPRLAPVQVVIIPVKQETGIMEYAQVIDRNLRESGVRVKLDDREGESMGFKINKWELKGVPIRLEVGANEVEEKMVTRVRRDNGTKSKFPVAAIKTEVPMFLEEIQKFLYEKQAEFLKTNMREAGSYDEFKKIMEEKRGMIKAFWCEKAGCETKIKEETKASTRCLPLGSPEEKGKCVRCGEEAKNKWVFAQAY